MLLTRSAGGAKFGQQGHLTLIHEQASLTLRRVQVGKLYVGNGATGAMRRGSLLSVWPRERRETPRLFRSSKPDAFSLLTASIASDTSAATLPNSSRSTLVEETRIHDAPKNVCEGDDLKRCVRPKLSSAATRCPPV